MKSRSYKIYRKTRQRIREFNTGIIDAFFLFLEAATGKLITYHVRPARAGQVMSARRKNAYPRSAIVIQGPVIEEKDFTLETIRIYKKYFPEAIIILSTWDDTSANAHEQIKKEGIDFILNKKPEVAGYKNINFQIASSAAGVMRANALGAEYILKTRTDQRFYNPHMLSSLYQALEVFPLFGHTRQIQRLVFSCASKRSDYRLYHASDMMIFGYAADMVAYWQAPMVMPDTHGNIEMPEQYLMKEFLKKIGHQPIGTVDDSDRVFADYCIILDLPMLDFYWYKYERHQEYKHLPCEGRESHNVSFLEWLSLYGALKKKT